MAAVGNMATAHRVGATRACAWDRAVSHVRACARPAAAFGRHARPLVLCQARPSKPQKVGSAPSPGSSATKRVNQASAVAVRDPSPPFSRSPRRSIRSHRPFAPIRCASGAREPRLDPSARLGPRPPLIHGFEATWKAPHLFASLINNQFDQPAHPPLPPAATTDRTRVRRAPSTRAIPTSARATAPRNRKPSRSPSHARSSD